jgi:hypothetical protein
MNSVEITEKMNSWFSSRRTVACVIGSKNEKEFPKAFERKSMVY